MTARKPTSERVSITLKQVNETQVTQGELLNKIDKKLDLMIQRGEQTDKKVEDHETRIRSVETSKWKAQGFAGAIGALVSVFGVYIALSLIHI